MARKKVRLQYVQNDTARKVTYNKRVKGISKKAEELSVLCGVDACAIVYGPYEKAPMVWPSVEAEANRILMNYKRKPDIDQSQRKLNQKSFLRQSVTKSEEKLLRLQRRNREMDVENMMSEILCGKPIQQVPFADLGDLIWVMDDKMRSVQHRIRTLEGPDDDAQNALAIVSTNPDLNLNSPVGSETMGGEMNALVVVTVPSEMQAGPSHY